MPAQKFKPIIRNFPLTNLQKKVFAAVKKLESKKPGEGPTFAQVAKEAGVPDTAIAKHLKSLARRGMLTWEVGVSGSLQTLEKPKPAKEKERKTPKPAPEKSKKVKANISAQPFHAISSFRSQTLNLIERQEQQLLADLNAIRAAKQSILTTKA